VFQASDQIVDMPHRFGEARELLAGLFRQGDLANISQQTMLAATMVEVIPRLVSLYGGTGAGMILAKLANQVSIGDGCHITQ
jgi:hypothetical protein